MAKKIGVINGPNLNILGTREPDIYGQVTLDQIIADLSKRASELGLEIEAFQANSEGSIVDEIQKLSTRVAGIIINPAAYTHTSVAILDAVKGTAVPLVELHISTVHARESFRHHSYLSATARAVMCGFGVAGYGLAIDAVAQW